MIVSKVNQDVKFKKPEVGDLLRSEATGKYYYIIESYNDNYSYVRLHENTYGEAYDSIEELIEYIFGDGRYEIIKSDQFELKIT